jgi:hypothetical protein
MAADPLFTDLPDGYKPRVTRKLAASTRKSWNESWDFDLRDLWVRGGHSWMLAGFGHAGSGILRAIESRGIVEVAVHPSKPLLVRLRPEGAQIARGLLEEKRDDRQPPADAELGYRPLPRSAYPARPTTQKIRPTVLTADDAHLVLVLRDEAVALEEALARFAQYEAADEIADYEMRDRHAARLPQIRKQIAELTGARS